MKKCESGINASSADEIDHTIIFTDLDGTLLDPHDYSCAKAKPLISQLQNLGIPIIFCSSKTYAEQEVYQKKLDIHDPFIVENGGAIYIKQGYFSFPFGYHRISDQYYVIELGISYTEVRKKIKEIRENNNLIFRGYGDMDSSEVARYTGLDPESAKLAKQREYEETLNLTGAEPDIQHILNVIESSGMKWNRGSRFYSVSGGGDKGKATTILISMFEREFGKVKTIGIGDSYNDIPMLREVDSPILVQKPGGIWEEAELKNTYYATGVGPLGWIRAITEFTGIK